ncbi:MAG: Holliday junction resolvase-like protein [Mariprofundaceae bacterium]|nr:Holliday junction resolvase-like protein [Mariprofundaceae bacterium]
MIIYILSFTLLACLILLAIGLVFLIKTMRKNEKSKETMMQVYEEKIRSLIGNQHQEIQSARKESVTKSRSVLRGKVAEQMAPLLPGFHYAAADARFMGDPIDYLVCDGYSALRDNTEQSNEVHVVLLDIKSGKASLSSSQRAIAQAVEAGRVRFEVVRVDDDGCINIKQWKSRQKKGASCHAQI